jgi:hypothetical protein
MKIGKVGKKSIAGRAKMGRCLTDAAPGAAPDVAVRVLPLRLRPNACLKRSSRPSAPVASYSPPAIRMSRIRVDDEDAFARAS